MKEFLDRFIIFFAYLVIKTICSTIRVERLDDSSYRELHSKGKNVIFAFWHRRLFYLGYYYSKNFKDRKTYVLVSKSKDGTRIGKIVEKMGIGYVQGSSSRGGAAGLKALLKVLRKGDNGAITPDGPRGPLFSIQKGILKLAQLSGAPIVPISYSPSKFIELKSWDRFVIPFPFCKVKIITGKPIYVKEGDIEKYETELKEALDKLESA